MALFAACFTNYIFLTKHSNFQIVIIQVSNKLLM
jgi:hypothetical protein